MTEATLGKVISHRDLQLKGIIRGVEPQTWSVPQLPGQFPTQPVGLGLTQTILICSLGSREDQIECPEEHILTSIPKQSHKGRPHVGGRRLK